MEEQRQMVRPSGVLCSEKEKSMEESLIANFIYPIS